METTLDQALEDIATALALDLPLAALPGMLVYKLEVSMPEQYSEKISREYLGVYPSQESALKALSEWCMGRWRTSCELIGIETPWRAGFDWANEINNVTLGPVEPAVAYMNSHTPEEIITEYFRDSYDMYSLTEEAVQPYTRSFQLQ